MNRAHADGLHEIALTLCRYLSSECRLDPNPSRPRPAAQEATIPVKPNSEEAPSESEGPALVPDLDYTIKDAAALTKKAEATIRKYISIGRLEGRKEGSRVYLSGRELARFMAKQVSDGDVAAL